MGPDFSLFNGNDSLALPALERGADGLVSGNASARPELLVSLFSRCSARGARDRPRRSRRSWTASSPGGTGASELSFFKALLALRGVPVGEVRPPLARLERGGQGGAAEVAGMIADTAGPPGALPRAGPAAGPRPGGAAAAGRRRRRLPGVRWPARAGRRGALRQPFDLRNRKSRREELRGASPLHRHPGRAERAGTAVLGPAGRPGRHAAPTRRPRTSPSSRTRRAAEPACCWSPGAFMVLFPQDAHKPGCRSAGSGPTPAGWCASWCSRCGCEGGAGGREGFSDRRLGAHRAEGRAQAAGAGLRGALAGAPPARRMPAPIPALEPCRATSWTRKG